MEIQGPLPGKPSSAQQEAVSRWQRLLLLCTVLVLRGSLGFFNYCFCKRQKDRGFGMPE